jgi:hypothetical protein
MYHFFLKIIDCVKINRRENKIFEINKLIAEKYEEEVNLNKDRRKESNVVNITDNNVNGGIPFKSTYNIF